MASVSRHSKFPASRPRDRQRPVPVRPQHHRPPGPQRRDRTGSRMAVRVVRTTADQRQPRRQPPHQVRILIGRAVMGHLEDVHRPPTVPPPVTSTAPAGPGVRGPRATGTAARPSDEQRDTRVVRPVRIGAGRRARRRWRRGGHSTCQDNGPVRRCSPATARVTGTRRSAAACVRTRPGPRALRSDVVSIAPTERPRSTPGSPATWSAWKWVSTTSGMRVMPSVRRQWSTSSGSGPASTTTPVPVARREHQSRRPAPRRTSPAASPAAASP